MKESKIYLTEGEISNEISGGETCDEMIQFVSNLNVFCVFAYHFTI